MHELPGRKAYSKNGKANACSERVPVLISVCALLFVLSVRFPFLLWFSHLFTSWSFHPPFPLHATNRAGIRRRFGLAGHWGPINNVHSLHTHSINLVVQSGKRTSERMIESMHSLQFLVSDLAETKQADSMSLLSPFQCVDCRQSQRRCWMTLHAKDKCKTDVSTWSFLRFTSIDNFHFCTALS